MGKKKSDPSDKNSNEHENLSLTSHTDSPMNYSGVRLEKPEGEEFKV
jgi:hypothetical protein